MNTNAVLVDTGKSPQSILRPVPVNGVRFSDGFWRNRWQTNHLRSLPSQYELLVSTGRLENFYRAAGTGDGPYNGYFFNDSDVYKWLEAACWSLSCQQDDVLSDMVETIIQAILAAQDRDGYLNTYFSGELKSIRWSDLRSKHELYCAGHFIQAAIAHYRVTGSERLLSASRKLFDHLWEIFGEGKRPGVPGHPEIEMALVELFRTTGDRRALRLAQSFLDQRGYGLIGGKEYHQDHVPFNELPILSGHTVRALYLCSGATDLILESDQPGRVDELELLWTKMIQQQMYITGGLGARHAGESFGDPYELPNQRAYAETCAAVGSVYWNWRMLQLTADARFADLIEWTLFNAFLPGVSIDGEWYFYSNPLADSGNQRRQPWYDCACCPTNVVRLMASLPGYLYSVSETGVYVHLYANNEASLTLLNGNQINLTQKTNYPWDGVIDIDVDGEGEFSLFLRIPAWVGKEKSPDLWLSVNDLPESAGLSTGSYYEICRMWHKGDRVRLNLPMPTRLIESHPSILENTNRVAVTRGPVLYCFEAVDNPGIDLISVILSMRDTPRYIRSTEFPGEPVLIQLKGSIEAYEKEWDQTLYRSFVKPKVNNRGHITNLLAVPYFLWANRLAGQMQTWMRVR